MSDPSTTEQQRAEDAFRQATEEFNEKASRLGLGEVRNFYWYHTIELREDLVTPGLYDFRSSLPAFQFPEDMRGMTVLDVGSATGFFAFEFENRGARVVSVDVPSLAALDRFPGQTVEQVVRKIEGMIFPSSGDSSPEAAAGPSAEELYFRLLEGPFEFCRRALESHVERCLSTVYELSSEKLGVARFDLVFMGDILLHTLHPLEALASVARLCGGTLVLSQVMPQVVDEQPAMLYVGGDDPAADEVSWWWPNQSCLVQLLRKLGFQEVTEVGRHSGLLRPSAHRYERPILHATK